MNSKLPALLLILVVLTSVYLVCSKACSQPAAEPRTSRTREKLYHVFEELLKIERMGYNITEQVNELNTAIKYIRLAEASRQNSSEYIAKAEQILSSIESQLPELREKAENLQRKTLIETVLLVAACAVLLTLLAVYGPKTAWRIWYERRKHWEVRKQ